MNLKKVWLKKYGPLNDQELVLEDGINVVNGPNESGKSLLVEALTKKFTGESVNCRVDEKPEGFVELKTENGSDKLDEDNLCTYYEEKYGRDIMPSEIQNIFIIQSANLAFEDKDSFYSHITDKLTGRRTEEIEEVLDKLPEKGRITKKRQNISTKYNDAGDQLEEAKSLRNSVETYIETAEDEKLDETEGKLLAEKQRKKKLERQVDELEKIEEERQKRERHSEMNQKKQEVEEALEQLEDLPEKEKLNELKTKIEAFDEEKGSAEALSEEMGMQEKLAKNSVLAGLGFPVVAGILVYLNIAPLTAFYILSVIGAFGFAAALYFYIQYRNTVSKKKEIDQSTKALVSEAEATGLEFEELSEARGEINEMLDKIDGLSDTTVGGKSVLESNLDFSAEDAEDAVKKAEEKLEELENNFNESIDIEQEIDEDVEQQFKDAEKKVEELDDELSEHREKLDRFDRKASKLKFEAFTGEPLQITVDSIQSLKKLRRRLNELVEEIEADAQAARDAMGIFEDMKAEETERTAELFEEGSRATELFKQITDHRYSRVSYDNEKNQIKVVKRKSGEEMLPEKLSDGARDQLYLAVRVALGEELLDGMPGFFIMDDAFISADPERLERQAKVLEKLAEQGWQIVYLSSKRDAINTLKKKTDNEPYEMTVI